MKRGAPLKTYARLERRTPLRARRAPDGGHNASRSTKALSRVGAVTQPLVAPEGQHIALFPKPAPRVKAAPARLKGSRIKAKPPRRLFGPDSDPAYLAFIREQPCDGIELFPGHVCLGPVDPDHLRNHTGIGRKEHDHTCIPKCRLGLHRQWTDRTGPFKDWSNERRLEFHLQRMAVMRAKWARLSEAQRERYRTADRSDG